MRAWLIAMLMTGSPAPGAGAVSPPAAMPPAQTQPADISGYESTTTRDDEDLSVAILCDPAKARVSVRLADRESLDRAYPARVVIAPESLIQPLPDRRGEARYRGSLTRYLQCGPYSLRLRGGFYNADVEGQLGAYPGFVTLDVFADNRMIVSRDGGGVAIGQCGRDDGLGPSCPSDWAVRLDVDHQPQRHAVPVTEHASSNRSRADDPGEAREHTSRRYEVDAPFALSVDAPR